MANKKKKTDEMSAVENKNKKFEIDPAIIAAIGAVLLILGVIFVPVSYSERVKEIDAVETFNEKAYFRRGAVVESNYNGHPVITAGELVYDEPGATDAVFGVSADSAMLYRISEMAQWKENEDGEVTLVWSEDIIPSPDEEHENPTSYPSNLKSNHYSALAVKVGDYVVSEDQLLLIEEREALTELPNVEVKGFGTAGEYITNSKDPASPSVGDVRIRYEYVKADVVTLVGKQRDTAIVSHTNFNDVPFFAVLSGEYSRGEVVEYFRKNASKPDLLMLIPAAAALICGAVMLFMGFIRAKKYSPTLGEFGKKAAALPKTIVERIYTAAFAVVIFSVTLALTWVSVYPIWTVITLFAAFIYFYILIADMVKNMPRRVKKEAEYVPILVKRENTDRK